MTKNLRRINPTESQIQMAIVEWANSVYSPYMSTRLIQIKKLGDFLIKITNEGKRSYFLGKKMKKEGLKKGVSDMFLAIPRKKFSGLWIEVKSKKGKLSIYQEEWFMLMKYAGYAIAKVRSVDEGIQAIKDYLGMR